MRIIIILTLLLTACAHPGAASMIDAQVDLSLAYYQQRAGNILLAERYYQRAIREAPRLGEAHNNYGVLLCQQKQYRQAIVQFLLAAHEPTYQHRQQAAHNAKRCRELHFSLKSTGKQKLKS